MTIITAIGDMQAAALAWRRAGKRIGFVPTMGYLHAGHMSLVRLVRPQADVVVVSIFVNPTQFGPTEDLSRYPRDFERDSRLCREAGVDVVFFPEPESMYAPDASTWVTEETLSKPLCGAARPGHFRGVTTVVTKLFNTVLPDVAAFGRKDAQQALVIQRMVRDLNFPIEIILGPTLREPDGLAMSSRNVYLSVDERRRAVAVSQALFAAEQAFAAGARDGALLCSQVRDRILQADGRIDYVDIRARATMEPLVTVTEPALLAVAAFFGRTRLIDNVFLG